MWLSLERRAFEREERRMAYEWEVDFSRWRLRLPRTLCEIQAMTDVDCRALRLESEARERRCEERMRRAYDRMIEFNASVKDKWCNLTGRWVTSTKYYLGPTQEMVEDRNLKEVDEEEVRCRRARIRRWYDEQEFWKE